MTNIHLTIPSKKPWNSTYRTPEGQVIYRVESATAIVGARNIKISKVIPTFNNDSITTTGREDEDLKDSFAHLATVEYHNIRSSRIRMGDLDVATNDYFRRGARCHANVGRDRIFTGPDGKEYFWRLGIEKCELFVNDSTETPVARFHRLRLGLMGDPHPASLEIFADGKEMVDLIVVTGVYMAKLREDKDYKGGD